MIAGREWRHRRPPAQWLPRRVTARGTIVQVGGSLAAPYGNLELRPDDAGDIVVIGSGGLPEPIRLDSSGLVESAEGSLAVITATLVDLDRYSSGAVSMLLRDDQGEARVYAFAPIQAQPTWLKRGQRLRVTGIVGQRASRTGASDGHRLWPRGQADLVPLDDGPPSSPPPDDDSPDGGDARPPRVAIADAVPGRTVTIVGTVTSRAGIVDTEGRRVTVQDGSGAILVRYPSGVRPAGVGRIIRASGEVGTWYGSIQLEADTAPRPKGRARVKPAVLRQPPGEVDEWRLVSVAVRITDLERDGDTWRAEAELDAGGMLPIAGLAGSGINPEPLQPGRSARITGLVRRAHPAATDQRFAVAPRSPKDLQLGRLVVAGARGDATDTEEAENPGASRSLATATAPGTVVLATTLGSLHRLTDRLVRVGGRLEIVSGRKLTLDDGTARGTIRLADGIEPAELALRVGEVLNATGRVHQQSGGPEVVVETAADVRRASRPVAATIVVPAPTPATTGQVESPTAPLDALVATASLTPTAGPGPLPLLAVGGLSAASLLLLAAATWLAWRWRRSAPSPTRV